jgi:TPR repeat protein
MLADIGDSQAQYEYGPMHENGKGIMTNKLLAPHYSKLSADQGNAPAQLNYGVMLVTGDGSAMNKSLAAEIGAYSVFPEGSEILNAASSGFKVKSVAGLIFRE